MSDTNALDGPASTPTHSPVESPARAPAVLESPALEDPAPGKPALEKPTLEKHAPESPALERPSLAKPPLENPETISADELHRILMDTFLLGQQVKRRFLGALLTLHVTRLHFHLGSPSTFEYASKHFGYEKSETYEMLRVAAALPGLPHTDEAFETGMLGWSAIKEVTRIADGETEAEWLALAAKSTVRVLRAEVESALSEKRRRPRKNRYGLPRLPVQVSFRLLPEQHELLQGALTIAAREMSVALGVERVKPVDALIYLATRIVEGQKVELPTSAAVEEAFKPYRILYRTCPCCRTSQIATPDGWVDVPWEVVQRVEDDAEKIVLPLESELEPQVAGGSEDGAAPLGVGASGDAMSQGHCPCCQRESACPTPGSDPAEAAAEDAAGAEAEGCVGGVAEGADADERSGHGAREPEGAAPPPAEEAREHAALEREGAARPPAEGARESADPAPVPADDDARVPVPADDDARVPVPADDDARVPVPADDDARVRVPADDARDPAHAAAPSKAPGQEPGPGGTKPTSRSRWRGAKAGGKARANSGAKTETPGGTSSSIVKDRPNTPALRRRVLARDGDRCSNPHCGNLADMSHHLVFLSEGGKTMEWNEVGDCRCCHALIHLGKLRAHGNPMTGVTYTSHADTLNLELRKERARLATVPLIRVVVVDRGSAAGLPPDPAGPAIAARRASSSSSGAALPAAPEASSGVSGASDAAAREAPRDPDMFELPLGALEKLGWSRKESLARLRVAFAELSERGTEFGENELFNRAVRVRRAEIAAA